MTEHSIQSLHWIVLTGLVLAPIAWMIRSLRRRRIPVLGGPIVPRTWLGTWQTNHGGAYVDVPGRGRLHLRPYILERNPLRVGVWFKVRGLPRITVRNQRGPSAFRTGDPDFDAVFTLAGSEPLLRALLGAHTRRQLLAAWRTPGEGLRNGRVRALLVDPHGQGPALVEEVDRIVRDVDRLRAVPDPWSLVAAHAEADPAPGVRSACRDLLYREGILDRREHAKFVNARASPTDPQR